MNLQQPDFAYSAANAFNYLPAFTDDFWDPDVLQPAVEQLCAGIEVKCPTKDDLYKLFSWIVSLTNGKIEPGAFQIKQFMHSKTQGSTWSLKLLAKGISPGKIVFPHNQTVTFDEKWLGALMAYCDEKWLSYEIDKNYFSYSQGMVVVARIIDNSSIHAKYGYTQKSKAYGKSLQGQAVTHIAFDEAASIAAASITPASHTATTQPVRNHKLMQQKVSCPSCSDTTGTLDGMIQHLNDLHKMPREEIADWIDTLPEQPIYYPDVDGRTDDEKIDQGIKLSSSVPVDNPIASVKLEPVKPPQDKACIGCGIAYAWTSQTPYCKPCYFKVLYDMGVTPEIELPDLEPESKPKITSLKYPCGCYRAANQEKLCGKCGQNGHYCYQLDKCPNSEPKYYGSSGYSHPTN